MKKIKFMSAIIFLAFILVGCSGINKSLTYSYTYSVETGDKVIATLDGLDGYKMDSKLPFSISKGDDIVSQGIFITLDTYQDNATGLQYADNVTVIDSGNKNGNEYIFWSYDESEYNYAILIGDSKTAVLLANHISEDSARECFDRIEFKIAK